jgi:DNA-directed RNA polymerase specialized sigma24 family protein
MNDTHLQDLTASERRDYAVAFLDAVYRQREMALDSQTYYIALARHHGLSYREIAEALHLGETTVRRIFLGASKSDAHEAIKHVESLPCEFPESATDGEA